jgi:hypothetical protein
MKHPKIIFTVEKTTDGYSAFAEYKGIIATVGDNYQHLKSMIVEATNLALEAEGRTVSLEEIELCVDLAQFFYFYKEINAKALAERSGVNRT